MHAWSAKEIVCHLRDVEELFQLRFHAVVALDEPRLLVLVASLAAHDDNHLDQLDRAIAGRP
jgi:hypothetical protein